MSHKIFWKNPWIKSDTIAEEIHTWMIGAITVIIDIIITDVEP